MRTRRSIFAVLASLTFIAALCLFTVHRVAHANSYMAGTPASARTAQNAVSSEQSASDPAKPSTLYFAENPELVPSFTARDLSGAPISTSDFKGKAIIINFWATWCGPCREEIPELIALQSQFKDTLQIIGISEDDGPPEQVAKFVQKAGINYPVIMASSAIEHGYGGIPALPTSFLVNKDGRVVQKDVGVYPFEYYSLQVRALLGLPVNARIETFKDTGQIFLRNASRASELPGVSFAGLTPAQKKLALHRLNAQTCTCGCKLTLAECRINDTSCPVSGSVAMGIIHNIAHPAAAASAKPGSI